MPLLDNLQVYYTCDEGGGVRADSHINSLDLTPNLPTGSKPGIINSAANFGSGGTYLFRAAAAPFDFGDEPQTINAWATVQTSTQFFNQGIAAKSDGVTNEYSLRFRGAFNRFEYIYGSGFARADNFGAPPTSSLDAGVFMMITCIHDPVANTVSIRVNNGTPNVSAHTTGTTAGTHPFNIGRSAVGNSISLIDEVGLWRRVLTPAEITELYNGGAGQPFANFTGSSTGHAVSVFFMKTAGWREGQYASSVAVRSVEGTTSGYSRQVSQTKDDSSTDHPLGSVVGDNNDFSLRFVRNYYTLPPSVFFQYYRTRVDLTEGALSHKEDGFRYYIRTYKHNQKHYVSGPCTVEGLVPHSFIHPESPAEDETFTFTDAINLNSFRLQFSWEPTFGHPDIQDTELELMRLSIDANNYIRLILEAQDRNEREYNLSDMHGGHDPRFSLEKWRGGSMVDSVSVVCYYGYDNREPSMESQSDTLIFTLDHMAGSGGYLALEIDKYKTRGRRTSTADLVSYPGDSVGDLIYNGVGWYGTPRIIVQDQSERTNNRKLPVFRTNLHLRGRAFDVPAIVSGDRDPTNGQRVQDNPYDLPEDFTRANAGNLGSDWDQIQVDGDGRNAGDGFDIASNKAQAFGSQFERWDSRPGHRDYRFRANVLVQADNDLVGLFTRYPNEFFAFGGEICGYGVELVQTGTTSASVRLVAWWLSNRTVLSTSPLDASTYTQGTEYRLRITCDGSTLTGEVFDLADLNSPIGTTTATTTLFRRAGRLGIYCEAPTNFVTIDDVTAEPLFAKTLTG